MYINNKKNELTYFEQISLKIKYLTNFCKKEVFCNELFKKK